MASILKKNPSSYASELWYFFLQLFGVLWCMLKEHSDLINAWISRQSKSFSPSLWRVTIFDILWDLPSEKKGQQCLKENQRQLLMQFPQSSIRWPGRHHRPSFGRWPGQQRGHWHMKWKPTMGSNFKLWWQCHVGDRKNRFWRSYL